MAAVKTFILTEWDNSNAITPIFDTQQNSNIFLENGYSKQSNYRNIFFCPRHAEVVEYTAQCIFVAKNLETKKKKVVIIKEKRDRKGEGRVIY